MKNKPSFLPWILLAIITAIFIYIRLRLINLPLERDEGEYAYGGQLILNGSPPYHEIYNMKFPGVYYFYALFILLFGSSIIAIRLGGLIINLLTAWLILKSGEAISNKLTGIFSAMAYMALSAAPLFMGITDNTEHFVNLFTVLSGYYLFCWLNEKKPALLFFAGLAAGLACLMKQHGAYMLLVVLLAIFINTPFKALLSFKSLKNFSFLLAGFIVILLILSASLILTGTGQNFLFFTIKYARSYVSYNSFGTSYLSFFSTFVDLTKDNQIMWVLIAPGLLFSFRLLPVKQCWVVLCWFVLSVSAIFPGYYFRPHYYLFMFPVSAIYFGLVFNKVFEWGFRQKSSIKRLFPPVLLLIPFAYFLINERNIFFNKSPAEVCVSLYDFEGYAFSEALTISKYIQEHTSANEKILVLGNEPEIYFYSHRKAASGYVYVYALTENHPFKDSMVHQFIRESVYQNPAVIVNGFINHWVFDSAFTSHVLNDAFHVNTNYTLAGFCYKDNNDRDIFLWKNDESGINPKKIVWEIYERRNRAF